MFCNIFTLDLKRAVLGKWRRFLAVLLYFVTVSLVCKISFANAYTENSELASYPAPTLGDFLLYVFGGSDLYIFDLNRPFIIPFQWLLLVLIAIYPNFDLTEESSAGVNLQLLLRTTDRTKYWLSKVLCIIISITLCFSLGVIVVLGCGLAFGGVPSFRIDSLILNVMNLSSLIPREANSPGFIPALMMVLLAFQATALLQQFFSLLIRSIGSFLVIASFMLLSAYFMTPLMFGSYAMMIRNSLICNGGVGALEGVMILLMVCLVAVVGGSFVYKRMDILNKGEY